MSYQFRPYSMFEAMGVLTDLGYCSDSTKTNLLCEDATDEFDLKHNVVDSSLCYNEFADDSKLLEFKFGDNKEIYSKSFVNTIMTTISVRNLYEVYQLLDNNSMRPVSSFTKVETKEICGYLMNGHSQYCAVPINISVEHFEDVFGNPFGSGNVSNIAHAIAVVSNADKPEKAYYGPILEILPSASLYYFYNICRHMKIAYSRSFMMAVACICVFSILPLHIELLNKLGLIAYKFAGGFYPCPSTAAIGKKFQPRFDIYGYILSLVREEFPIQIQKKAIISFVRKFNFKINDGRSVTVLVDSCDSNLKFVFVIGKVTSSPAEVEIIKEFIKPSDDLETCQFIFAMNHIYAGQLPLIGGSNYDQCKQLLSMTNSRPVAMLDYCFFDNHMYSGYIDKINSLDRAKYEYRRLFSVMDISNSCPFESFGTIVDKRRPIICAHRVKSFSDEAHYNVFSNELMSTVVAMAHYYLGFSVGFDDYLIQRARKEWVSGFKSSITTMYDSFRTIDYIPKVVMKPEYQLDQLAVPVTADKGGFNINFITRLAINIACESRKFDTITTYECIVVAYLAIAPKSILSVSGFVMMLSSIQGVYMKHFDYDYLRYRFVMDIERISKNFKDHLGMYHSNEFLEKMKYLYKGRVFHHIPSWGRFIWDVINDDNTWNVGNIEKFFLKVESNGLGNVRRDQRGNLYLYVNRNYVLGFHSPIETDQ